MIWISKDPPKAPVLFKRLLEKMLHGREKKGRTFHLEEGNALLRQPLFGRKSEQPVDPVTPKLAMFNEVESDVEVIGRTR